MTDAQTVRRRVVVSWLAAHLGVPAPRRARDPEAGANKRCRNARLLASGYAFRYPSFREGYPDIVRAFLREQASER